MMLELRRTTWDHLVIPLPDGGFGYAVAIAAPWMAIYGVRLAKPTFLPPQDLPQEPAFVIRVHEAADWRTMGNAVVDSLNPHRRRRYRVQLGYPPVFRLVEPDGSETVVDETACDGVEPATTWHPEDVTKRLASWLAGDRDVPRIRFPKSLLGAPPLFPSRAGRLRASAASSSWSSSTIASLIRARRRWRLEAFRAAGRLGRPSFAGSRGYALRGCPA